MSEQHNPLDIGADEILAMILSVPEHEKPFALLGLIEQRREELIPLFQRETDRAFELSKRGELQDKGDWKVPGFGLAFLSEWRVPGTHQRLLEVLKLNDDDRDWLIADALTEDWPRLLATTFEGDLQPITQVVLDQSLYEFARAIAVEAVAALAHHGVLAREESDAWFASLFEQVEREPCYVWDKVVCAVADLRMIRLLPEIRRAYKDHLCDGFGCEPLSDLEKVIVGENPWERIGMTRRVDYPEPEVDARKMICDWPHFHPPMSPASAPDRGEGGGEEDWPLIKRYVEMEALAPPQAKPKIGRNEPCPCGSGKKFKKCCGGL